MSTSVCKALLCTIAIWHSARAAAQDGILSDQPSVRQVQEELARTCHRVGLRADFVADFASGVDADMDGQVDDMLLDASGLYCGRTADNMAPFNHAFCDPSGHSCMQWIVINDQIVWRGRYPHMFAMGEDGLIDQGIDCQSENPCMNRVYWNGQEIVPWVPPRRSVRPRR